ncbi:helix-turn-helix transcriptional regulator [Naasia lichenicola]|uniref:DNA-binding protein n=1 Tax=Naasia lichenicola TaxID=2565933 RepID=A0A4S4FJK3_9MICO|nr:DNA-binding protein [Naasia lichenicola]THG29316.1 DNA-binding protein [Naasia lichenicola]
MSEQVRQLLTPEQVAAALNITTAQLAAWRAAGTGPNYFSLPEGVIRYGPRQLADWIRRDIPLF